MIRAILLELRLDGVYEIIQSSEVKYSVLQFGNKNDVDVINDSDSDIGM